MTLVHLTIDTRSVDIIKLHENTTNLSQIQTEKETTYGKDALRTRKDISIVAIWLQTWVDNDKNENTYS